MDRDRKRAARRFQPWFLGVVLAALMTFAGCGLAEGRYGAREAAAGAELVSEPGEGAEATGAVSGERLEAAGAVLGERPEAAETEQEPDLAGEKAAAGFPPEEDAEKPDRQKPGPEGGRRQQRAGAVGEADNQGDTWFNRQIQAVLAQAEEELGMKTQYLKSERSEDYKTNIQQLAEEKYGLILVSGRAMAEEAREIAEAYPNVRIVFVEDRENGDLENGVCLRFDQLEAAYLAGVAAGMITRTGRVGLVLDETGDRAAGYGYCAGVLDGNPDGVIIPFWENPYGDAREEKKAAASLAGQQVDVVFFDAGRKAAGMLDACWNLGLQVIAGSGDIGREQEERCLALTVNQIQAEAFDKVKAYALGDWEHGVAALGLYNGGVEFQMNEGLLPEAVRTAVLTVEEKLKAGEIIVPDTKEAFEAAYGERDILSASDKK